MTVGANKKPKTPQLSPNAALKGNAASQLPQPRQGPPNPAAPARPADAFTLPTIRDPGELSVVWRTVEIAEKFGYVVDENPRGAAPHNPSGRPMDPGDWRGQYRENLCKFLEDRQSSLTPYEANKLATGLFGKGQSTTSSNGTHTLGDRVSVKTPNGPTKGIVIAINANGSLGVLVAKFESGSRKPVPIQVSAGDVTTLSPALIDRRPL